MTLDPFKRLALITLTGLAAFLLVLIRARYGANAAVFVTVTALVVAFGVSLEADPPPEDGGPVSQARRRGFPQFRRLDR